MLSWATGMGLGGPLLPPQGHLLSPPPAATALHPSARRRKRRLERNTDVTGRMDTTSGWGQRGWLGTERAGWGQKGLLGTVGLGGSCQALELGWDGSTDRDGCSGLFMGPPPPHSSCHLPHPAPSWRHPSTLVPIPWGCPAFTPRWPAQCVSFISASSSSLRSESGSRKKRRHR